ncbi:hypothetical protein CI610_02564 [invertebrate metagenome]|uniref:Uncharacterized protein n=1 Tax=invertebrate metagenome TaxID=1711999 RepID=A0A2H9T5J1_9ZZZZ
MSKSEIFNYHITYVFFNFKNASIYIFLVNETTDLSDKIIAYLSILDFSIQEIENSTFDESHETEKYIILEMNSQQLLTILPECIAIIEACIDETIPVTTAADQKNTIAAIAQTHTTDLNLY